MTRPVSPTVRNGVGAVNHATTAAPTVNQSFDVARRGALGVTVDARNTSLTVTNVYQGSVAENLGLRAGDQLVSIDGRKVSTHADLISALNAAADAGQSTQIVFQRGGQTYQLAADLSGQSASMPLLNSPLKPRRISARSSIRPATS